MLPGSIILKSIARFLLVVLLVFSQVELAASNKDYCSLSGHHTMCMYQMTSSLCVKYSAVQNQEIIENIVKDHNKARSKYASGHSGFFVSNMLKMYWDQELADISARWSCQCKSGQDRFRDVDRFKVAQIVWSQHDSRNYHNWTELWHNILNLDLPGFYVRDYWGNMISNANKSNPLSIIYNPNVKYLGCTLAQYHVWVETVQELVYKTTLVCNYGPHDGIPKQPPVEDWPCRACPPDHPCFTDYYLTHAIPENLPDERNLCIDPKLENLKPRPGKPCEPSRIRQRQETLHRVNGTRGFKEWNGTLRARGELGGLRPRQFKTNDGHHHEDEQIRGHAVAQQSKGEPINYCKIVCRSGEVHTMCKYKENKYEDEDLDGQNETEETTVTTQKPAATKPPVTTVKPTTNSTQKTDDDKENKHDDLNGHNETLETTNTTQKPSETEPLVTTLKPTTNSTQKTDGNEIPRKRRSGGKSGTTTGRQEQNSKSGTKPPTKKKKNTPKGKKTSTARPDSTKEDEEKRKRQAIVKRELQQRIKIKLNYTTVVPLERTKIPPTKVTHPPTTPKPLFSNGRRCRHFLPMTNTLVIDDLLLLHNKYRNDFAEGAVGSPHYLPGNMLIMGWDKSLQAIAERWIRQCHLRQDECRDSVFEDPWTGNMRLFEVGQNIGWRRFRDVAQTPSHRDLFNGWLNGSESFPGRTIENILEFENKNASVCDYSQIVWASTYMVGCAFAVYEDTISRVAVLVCNYAPVGCSMGKPVYIPGGPCTLCDSDSAFEFSRCTKEFPNLCSLEWEPNGGINVTSDSPDNGPQIAEFFSSIILYVIITKFGIMS